MDAATCPVDGATMMPRSRRRLRTALSAVMGLPSASAIWPVRTGIARRDARHRSEVGLFASGQLLPASDVQAAFAVVPGEVDRSVGVVEGDACVAVGGLPGVVAEQLHEVRVAAGGVGEHGERVAVEGSARGVGGAGECLQGGVVVEVVDRVERHSFAVGDGVGDEPGCVGQPAEHDHRGEFRSAAEVLHDRSEH